MNTSIIFEQIINHLPCFQCVSKEPLIYVCHACKTQVHYIAINQLNYTPPPSITNYKIVRVYQDQLLRTPEVITSRLGKLCGSSTKIHARQTVVKRINKEEADLFLQKNHLQGNTGAYYKFGLVHQNKLVAVATFSKARTMYDQATYYKSYELERFATINNHQVVGGLSKLLHHFITQFHVKHLMTYVDLDWGDEGAFEKLGFKLVAKTDALYYAINPSNFTRTLLTQKPEILQASQMLITKNSGNHKYILNLLNQ